MYPCPSLTRSLVFVLLTGLLITSLDLAACTSSAGPQDSDVFTLTVEVTYHALATAGIKVHIYSSYDGLVYDTEELKDARGSPVFGDAPFTPNEVVRMTKDIVFGSRYIRVTVENENVNQPVTGVEVTAVVSR